MKKQTRHYDVSIIGGGLAGLVASARLSLMGARVALVDSPVPGTPGLLGGFARFSGAKFSLFPAGSGLVPLVGDKEALCKLYAEVVSFFSQAGIEKFRLDPRMLQGDELFVEEQIAYRNYHSIVLTPEEISILLAYMERQIGNVDLIRDSVECIELEGAFVFGIALGDESKIASDQIIVASGRLGGGLLVNAGVPQTEGKGMDFGVRLEFPSRSPLVGLRERGPDAKILSHGVRTFCLNSPGRIFHYPALGFLIPGGIVAEDDAHTSNVGILRRIENKSEALAAFADKARSFDHKNEPLTIEGNNAAFSLNKSVNSLLPEGVAEEIRDFVVALEGAGLLSLPKSFAVHYPLLDWHWPVFARPGTLRTEVEGLYVVGDLSGHARGLLQAAAMGWLVADEVQR